MKREKMRFVRIDFKLETDARILECSLYIRCSVHCSIEFLFVAVSRDDFHLTLLSLSLVRVPVQGRKHWKTKHCLLFVIITDF